MISLASSSSGSSRSGELFTEPILPWLERPVNPSRASTPTMNSSGSDIHIMKRHVPVGAPTIPVKKYGFWTWQKVWLLLMNSLLFAYGLITLILGLCTYFKLYQRAMVFLIGDKVVVNLVTATGVLCLFTSLLGFVGLLMNNRAILTIYNLLMWPCFGMICSIGYYCYRKSKWNIEGKLSYQWHYELSSVDRGNIQSNLHCCGYKAYTDFHERSNKCYPRTLYPGCKYKYQTLTTEALKNTWIVAFSMVPVHIMVLASAILCSNHVNNKFGKGLPPKLYHLDYTGIIAASPNVSSVNLAYNGELHRRNI